MNAKDIDPKVAVGVIAAIVIVAGTVYWMSGSVSSKKVEVTAPPTGEGFDPTPIRPGQPGYRQRTTDPPAK